MPILEPYGYSEADVVALVNRCNNETAGIQNAVSAIMDEKTPSGWATTATATEKKEQIALAKERKAQKEKERVEEAEREKIDRAKRIEEERKRHLAEARQREEMQELKKKGGKPGSALVQKVAPWNASAATAEEVHKEPAVPEVVQPQEPAPAAQEEAPEPAAEEQWAAPPGVPAPEQNGDRSNGWQGRNDDWNDGTEWNNDWNNGAQAEQPATSGEAEVTAPIVTRLANDTVVMPQSFWDLIGGGQIPQVMFGSLHLQSSASAANASDAKDSKGQEGDRRDQRKEKGDKKGKGSGKKGSRREEKGEKGDGAADAPAEDAKGKSSQKGRRNANDREGPGGNTNKGKGNWKGNKNDKGEKGQKGGGKTNTH